MKSRKNEYLSRLAKKLGFKLAEQFFAYKQPKWVLITHFFHALDALRVLGNKSLMLKSFEKVTNN